MHELTLCDTLEVSNPVLEFSDKMEKNVTNIKVILPASGFHCKTKA